MLAQVAQGGGWVTHTMGLSGSVTQWLTPVRARVQGGAPSGTGALVLDALGMVIWLQFSWCALVQLQ